MGKEDVEVVCLVVPASIVCRVCKGEEMPHPRRRSIRWSLSPGLPAVTDGVLPLPLASLLQLEGNSPEGGAWRRRRGDGGFRYFFIFLQTPAPTRSCLISFDNRLIGTWFLGDTY